MMPKRLKRLFLNDASKPKIPSAIMKATIDYTPSTDLGLKVNVGDRIEVAFSDNVSHWRYAKNITTKEYGYIDINLLSEHTEEKPWYFGETPVCRAMVLLEDCETGTFLVYERQNDEEIPYGMLIRFNNETKHYGIFKKDDCYLISNGYKAKNLETLIQTYKEDIDLVLGLCTRPVEPCTESNPAINNLSILFKDKIEIKRDHIKIGQVLGGGFSSQVYKGEWRNKLFAIKSLSGNFSREDFQKEVMLHKKLQHENIVQFFGISTLQKPYFIILEFMKFGDLASYLKNHNLKEYQRIHIASQVANGMAYLSKKGVVHRDLAARNVLLEHKLTAKISDFGISRLTDSLDDTYHAVTERKLPIKWLAPECPSSRCFTQFSDVWAFSIFLMEIYTRQAPYTDLKHLSLHDFFQAIEDGHRMSKPYNMSGDIYNLCTQCWNRLPNLRPNFAQISSYLDKYIVVENIEISDPFIITGIKSDKSKIMKAEASYTPVTERGLEFKAGDILVVEHSNDNWCRAQNLSSKKFGYVNINSLYQPESSPVTEVDDINQTTGILLPFGLYLLQN